MILSEARRVNLIVKLLCRLKQSFLHTRHHHPLLIKHNPSNPCCGAFLNVGPQCWLWRMAILALEPLKDSSSSLMFKLFEVWTNQSGIHDNQNIGGVLNGFCAMIVKCCLIMSDPCLAVFLSSGVKLKGYCTSFSGLSAQRGNMGSWYS